MRRFSEPANEIVGLIPIANSRDDAVHSWEQSGRMYLLVSKQQQQSLRFLITDRQRARQLEQAIRSDPTFRSLSPTDKARAEHILRLAANRSPEEHLYYVTALRALLRPPYAEKTPDERSQALGAMNETIMFEAVVQEQNRTEWKSFEELLSGMGSQSVRAGLDGKMYRVNRENPDLASFKSRSSQQRASVSGATLTLPAFPN